MNSGADRVLVRKARGLRHLLATVPAMLTETRVAQFQRGEQLEASIIRHYHGEELIQSHLRMSTLNKPVEGEYLFIPVFLCL